MKTINDIGGIHRAIECFWVMRTPVSPSGHDLVALSEPATGVSPEKERQVRSLKTLRISRVRSFLDLMDVLVIGSSLL